MNRAAIDEVDLKIVNAFQIHPRAPWNLVASVVGVDPATAARRWARLNDLGAAWISCYPPFDPMTRFAFVQINCAQGRTVEVARHLAADPQVMTANIHAGGSDMIAEVVARSMNDLANYLLDRLPSVDGIREVRTFPLIRRYAEASRWRLRALNAADEQRLATVERPGVGEWPRELTAQERTVAAALRRDPRISASALAAQLGVSHTTAARRLNAVLNTAGNLRCEMARGLSGWKVQATFFADCPANRIDETARALLLLREVRAIASIAGEHNMFVSVWLHELADVQSFEARLADTLPHMRVADRTVVIRTVKLVGRLLDDDGWSIGQGALDFEPPARSAADQHR